LRVRRLRGRRRRLRKNGRREEDERRAVEGAKESL
jgi:hypothetical protein